MIPEPSSAYGLWPKIKAISGWPQTNETQVQTLADGLTTATRAFEKPAGYTTAGTDASWPDEAGRMYGDSTRTVLAKAASTAADTSQLATAASSFATVVTGVKQQLTSLVDNNLTAYASLALLPPAIRVPFELAFVSTLGLYGKGLMTAAAAQASALGAITPAAPAMGPGGSEQLPPPPPGTSQDNANWWKGLTAEQRERYLRERPEWIGNLNGLPTQVRDEANRQVLIANRAQVQAEHDRLQGELRQIGSAPGRGAERARLETQIAAAEARLKGLDDLQATLDKHTFDNMGRELDQNYLLGFDPTGNGRFIVAQGNPDTATNIATFVPGAASGLNESGRALQRGDNLYDAAARAGAKPGDTAVITWLGYDSPGVIEALGSHAPARDGAPALAEFQRGLTVARGGADAHTTLVGHSYGARVIGTAASANPLLADEVVGAGALDFGSTTSHRQIQHVNQLRMDPEHVWVIEHRDDFAADLEGPTIIDKNGEAAAGGPSDPAGDPSRPVFGAQVYGAEPGPYVDSTVGLRPPDAHGNMLDPDAEHIAGLDRMGRIIVSGRAE